MAQAFKEEFIRRLESLDKVPSVFAQEIRFTQFTFSLVSVQLVAYLGANSVTKTFEYAQDKDVMILRLQFFNNLIKDHHIMTQVDISLEIPLHYFGENIKSSRDIKQDTLDKVLARCKVVILECFHDLLPDIVEEYKNKKFPMCGKKSVVRKANKLLEDIFFRK